MERRRSFGGRRASRRRKAMLYSVIMAGGSGTRFWPLSRRSMPKQALRLFGGKSLFEMALERVEGLTPPERTFVVTTQEQAELLAEQAANIPRENIVAEPFGRDSAAAVFLSAAIVGAKDAEAVILLKASDHLISPVERFHGAARKAEALAEDGHMLVTFGVPPSYAATRYGYIERGEPTGEAAGCYRVARFHEKPDAATAGRYVEEGRYYWNSGIFVWRAADILAAAKEFTGEHYRAIAPLGELFGAEGFAEALAAAYEPLSKVSIDYAVMEKAPNIAMVEADFQWNDLGSPLALRECMEPDEDGNVRKGLIHALESTGCVALSDEAHLVALVGCENLVVIHTDDATLVCRADRAGEVKRLVGMFEEHGGISDYL